MKMKKILCIILALVMCSFLAACADTEKSGSDENSKLPETTEKDTPTDGADSESGTDPVHVEMSVKDFGVIQLELYPDIAPITVENFVSLANKGFYDGLTFHRIVSGFMIQGGDPKGNGTGGSEEEIKGEFSANGVENPLSHTRGVISMARSNDYDSASSQFFIMHADNKNLDGQYAAFGKVIEGMDVVDKIASVKVEYASAGSREKSSPVEPVYIEYVKVVD